MAGRRLGTGNVVRAAQRGEARDLLFARRQPAGKMPGIAAEIVGRDSIRQSPIGAGRNRLTVRRPRWARPIGRRRARSRGRSAPRAAGMLMVGVPWAAGERAGAKDALAEIDIGRIQGCGPQVKASGAQSAHGGVLPVTARGEQDGPHARGKDGMTTGTVFAAISRDGPRSARRAGPWGEVSGAAPSPASARSFSPA